MWGLVLSCHVCLVSLKRFCQVLFRKPNRHYLDHSCTHDCYWKLRTGHSTMNIGWWSASWAELEIAWRPSVQTVVCYSRHLADHLTNVPLPIFVFSKKLFPFIFKVYHELYLIGLNIQKLIAISCIYPISCPIFSSSFFSSVNCYVSIALLAGSFTLLGKLWKKFFQPVWCLPSCLL